MKEQITVRTINWGELNFEEKQEVVKELGMSCPELRKRLESFSETHQWLEEQIRAGALEGIEPDSFVAALNKKIVGVHSDPGELFANLRNIGADAGNSSSVWLGEFHGLEIPGQTNLN